MRQRVGYQPSLSMGALLVLPQCYFVHQVRSGRKQPGQRTCVPGCSWQGPHPFQPLLRSAPHYSTFSNFHSRAWFTACIRLLTCNFSYICFKCHLTVSAEIPNTRAISLFE